MALSSVIKSLSRFLVPSALVLLCQHRRRSHSLDDRLVVPLYDDSCLYLINRLVHWGHWGNWVKQTLESSLQVQLRARSGKNGASVQHFMRQVNLLLYWWKTYGGVWPAEVMNVHTLPSLRSLLWKQQLLQQQRLSYCVCVWYCKNNKTRHAADTQRCDRYPPQWKACSFSC